MGCSSVLHKTTKFFKRKEILQKGKRVCVLPELSLLSIELSWAHKSHIVKRMWLVKLVKDSQHSANRSFILHHFYLSIIACILLFQENYRGKCGFTFEYIMLKGILWQLLSLTCMPGLVQHVFFVPSATETCWWIWSWDNFWLENTNVPQFLP